MRCAGIRIPISVSNRQEYDLARLAETHAVRAAAMYDVQDLYLAFHFQDIAPLVSYVDPQACAKQRLEKRLGRAAREDRSGRPSRALVPHPPLVRLRRAGGKWGLAPWRSWFGSGRNAAATVPVPLFRLERRRPSRKRGQAPSPQAVVLGQPLSRRRSQSPFPRLPTLRSSTRNPE